MKKVIVNLESRSYPICVGVKLQDLGKTIIKYCEIKRNITPALIVTNPRIKKLYGEIVAQSLKKAGFRVNIALVPEGEQAKTLDHARALYQQCLKASIDRKSLIVALGGGVVGDLAGFVASTFKRGIPLVQVPTTLLAQVDSSIGGKTGVDLPEGKNLVGAFYQPVLVWEDLSTLKTLPQKEWRNGMAEVIKYGVIRDEQLFKMLEKVHSPQSIVHSPKPNKNQSRFPIPDSRLLENVIYYCAKIKAEVVSEDETEQTGLRHILNYGHTLGHVIETAGRYKKCSHGEAVAIGMVMAARIATQKKMLAPAENKRIKSVIEKYGLPTDWPAEIKKSAVFPVLQRDKKSVNKKVKFVLPTKIGTVIVTDKVSKNDIKSVAS